MNEITIEYDNDELSEIAKAAALIGRDVKGFIKHRSLGQARQIIRIMESHEKADEDATHS